MKKLIMIFTFLFIVFSGVAQTNKFVSDSTQTIKAKDQGNGVGYRLYNQKTPFFGKIGLGATDVSNEYQAINGNTTTFAHIQPYFTNGGFGATGRFSFVTGGANVSGGSQSAVFGLGNISLGSNTIVSGQANQILGASNGSSMVGLSNKMNNSVATFMTGLGNDATANYSAVGGGSEILMNSNQSGSLGGFRNKTTTSANSTLIGGFSNEILYTSSASIMNSYGSKITGRVGNNNLILPTILGSFESKIDVSLNTTTGFQRSAVIIGSDSVENVGKNRSNGIYSSWRANIEDNGLDNSTWQLTSVIIGGRGSTIKSTSNNFVQGTKNIAQSHDEIIFGHGATIEPKKGQSDMTMKLFRIGNGMKVNNTTMGEYDTEAMITRKNAWYVTRGGDAESMGTTTATQFIQSADAVAPASITATGKKGEIRVTKDYLYFCYDTNKWSRTPMVSTGW